MAMISIREYAERHGRCVGAVSAKVRGGAYPSARKVGEQWYIDEDEPWEGLKTSKRKKNRDVQPVQLEINGKILILEYCKRHSLKRRAVSDLCKKGKLKSAEKNGIRWFIDADEIFNENHIEPGMITIKEYCLRYNLNNVTVYYKCRHGEMKSAVKIDGKWYIDENEPYIDRRFKHGRTIIERRNYAWFKEKRSQLEAKGMIGLKEYSKRNNLYYPTVLTKCNKGEFQSTVKVNNRWFIDENEPYPGTRRRSKRSF